MFFISNKFLYYCILKRFIMTETTFLPVNEIIKNSLDGRTYKWLRDRLAEKGINLTNSQISQRMAGNTAFSGEEAIACFQILNIELKTERA